MNYQAEIDKLNFVIDRVIKNRALLVEKSESLGPYKYDNSLNGKIGSESRKIRDLKNKRLYLVVEQRRAYGVR